MRIFIILFVILITCFGCNQQGSNFLTKEEVEVVETGITPKGPQNSRVLTGCKDPLNHVPDPNNPNMMPLREVMLNFHIMRNGKGTGNFTNIAADAYVKQWIRVANKKIKNNKRMNLPLGHESPTLFPNYKYVLASHVSKPGVDGIYYHNDEELYYMVNSGKNRNDYNKDVFEKYGERKGKELNVFIMPHHPDSIKSKRYRNISCGIAFPKDNWTKIAGVYFLAQDTTMRKGKPYVKGAWHCHGVFNHELGHVLGLRHSWAGNDYCEDTPHHGNCYSANEPGTSVKCRTEWSNNVMDYNTHQNSWSPCQIGLIQRNFADINSSQRKVLKKNWCTLKPDLPVIVNQDMVWKGSRDLESHLIIESGKSLTIKCRVSLPRNAYILVAQGARLILDGCTIENDCGDKWEGIRLLGGNKNKGRVIFMNDPQLNNMRRTL